MRTHLKEAVRLLNEGRGVTKKERAALEAAMGGVAGVRSSQVQGASGQQNPQVIFWLAQPETSGIKSSDVYEKYARCVSVEFVDGVPVSAQWQANTSKRYVVPLETHERGRQDDKQFFAEIVRITKKWVGVGEALTARSQKILPKARRMGETLSKVLKQHPGVAELSVEITATPTNQSPSKDCADARFVAKFSDAKQMDAFKDRARALFDLEFPSEYKRTDTELRFWGRFPV